MLYGLQQILYTIFPDLPGVLNKLNVFMDKKESFLKFHDLNGSRLNQCHIINRKQKSIREMHRIRMVLLRSILHNVDRVSMAHSVEIRNPFLDYRLIEFSLCLPASLKILNGTHKYILRKAAQDILPAKVLERKDKMGFPSPESQWAKGPLENFYREGLRDLSDISFINSKVVLDDFERFTKGLIPYNRIFWRLIGFQRWMKIFKISV
jgi:asparagine synthase (glutamine-hydrolysing)